MKRIVASLFALAFAFALGMANAEQAKGIVKQLDAQTAVLVLEDGTQFTLAEGIDIEGIKAGDEVTVAYEMKDGQKVAKDLTKAE